MWNLVSSKCICDQDCLFLLFLCLNWQSDLVIKDLQQGFKSILGNGTRNVDWYFLTPSLRLS